MFSYVEQPYRPSSVSPRGRDINLHFRTLSTHARHPDARKPVIQFRLPYNPHGNDLSVVTIQLVDDILSLFFSSGPSLPRLLLWDWKTAILILVGGFSVLLEKIELKPYTRIL
jgi:hypothetical protein